MRWVFLRAGLRLRLVGGDEFGWFGEKQPIRFLRILICDSAGASDGACFLVDWFWLMVVWVWELRGGLGFVDGCDRWGGSFACE